MGQADSASSEKVLLKQLQNPLTREKAFAAIVNKYSGRLYWHIRHIVYNHEDANDLLQNTFLKAWVGLPNFRGKAKLYTWLYRIAVFEALNYAKKNKRELELFLSDGGENYVGIERAEGDCYFDGDQAERNFQKAILSLPPKQKEVFLLRYYDDMSYEEISKLTGTSEGALKATYHHAVKKIKDFLQRLY